MGSCVFSLAVIMSEAKSIETVSLSHRTGKSSLQVSLFGATVTSWKIFKTEMLFLSKKASLDGSRAIRGGIPLVFPQFGPGKLKQHGFARTQLWEHVSTDHDLASGDVHAVFKLTSNDATRAEWPHDFELTYAVTLGMTNLITQLTCVNTGETDFDFTALLHTYFHVEDIAKATVSGLGKVAYLDNTDEKKQKMQVSPVLTFEGEVDRIFLRDVKDESTGTARMRYDDLISIGDGGNADVVVKAVNFKDLVVWNPGASKSASMPDMEEEGYKRFVCVEVGSVAKPVSLKPKASWSAGQNLTLRILQSGTEEARRVYGRESVPGVDNLPILDRIVGIKKKDPAADNKADPK